VTTTMSDDNCRDICCPDASVCRRPASCTSSVQIVSDDASSPLRKIEDPVRNCPPALLMIAVRRGHSVFHTDFNNAFDRIWILISLAYADAFRCALSGSIREQSSLSWLRPPDDMCAEPRRTPPMARPIPPAPRINTIDHVFEDIECERGAMHAQSSSRQPRSIRPPAF